MTTITIPKELQLRLLAQFRDVCWVNARRRLMLRTCRFAGHEGIAPDCCRHSGN